MLPLLNLSQILDSSKLKEFADNIFKFDENGRKLSKQVEILWDKEKLHVISTFSFSHSVFKRLTLQTHKNQGLFENGSTILASTPFNSLPNDKNLD